MEVSAPTLILILVVAALAGVAAWRLRGYLRVRSMQRRFRRGRAGEEGAPHLLERQGYAILQEQATRQHGLWVDGRWQPVTVRADYLVEKGGRRYVVEVKTGRKAPNPAAPATRRQLLEYSHVYDDADGLLLADMEADRLREIRFLDRPHTAAGVAQRPWKYIAWGALGGLTLGAAASLLWL